MVNLYNMTRKLAFGNKLVIIEVIFASPFTLTWGITFGYYLGNNISHSFKIITIRCKDHISLNLDTQYFSC